MVAILPHCIAQGLQLSSMGPGRPSWPGLHLSPMDGGPPRYDILALCTSAALQVKRRAGRAGKLS